MQVSTPFLTPACPFQTNADENENLPLFFGLVTLFISASLITDKIPNKKPEKEGVIRKRASTHSPTALTRGIHSSNLLGANPSQ